MFAGLKEAELDALVRLFRPRLLLPDEVFIRRGGRGRNMFFISSGAVEVRLPNERIRLGSGDFVGEMALLRRQRRQADVVSLGYGRVPELGAVDFRTILGQVSQRQSRNRADGGGPGVCRRKVASGRWRRPGTSQSVRCEWR